MFLEKYNYIIIKAVDDYFIIKLMFLPQKNNKNLKGLNKKKFIKKEIT